MADFSNSERTELFEELQHVIVDHHLLRLFLRDPRELLFLNLLLALWDESTVACVDYGVEERLADMRLRFVREVLLNDFATL